MSPMRRDAEGNRQVGPTWESLTERLIREAMEEGQFDDLPFRGERLPIDDESAAGDRALAFRVLRNAGVAPPWIESDKEARDLLARIEALIGGARPAPRLGRRRRREELERLIEAANRAILRLNNEAPTTAQHRRPIDRDALLARFDGRG